MPAHPRIAIDPVLFCLTGLHSPKKRRQTCSRLLADSHSDTDSDSDKRLKGGIKVGEHLIENLWS